VTVRVDNRLADAPMTAVDCRRCAATVFVRKSSRVQTSVQWTAAARDACQERQESDRLAAHGTRGVFLVCSALRESIVDAVRQGALVVVVDDTSVVST
jgi:hydrogenase maturation factor HypF (carbamoyltransferase family)